MASKSAWGMPQAQPQHTWDGGASDNQPPPPTYEEAISSMPQPHAPFTPSYHPSAPTAPYPSSYPYPTSSCMPSAPTTDPTTKPHYPTEIPHPVTVPRPNTAQHVPLRASPRAASDIERDPVVMVARQPSQQEENTKPAVNSIMALGAVVIVVMLLLRLIIF